MFFEDEEGERFPIEGDGALTFKGHEIICSSQCECLITYEGGVYIEKLKSGTFVLAIENHSWQGGNLAELEKILFDWSYDSQNLSL